MAIFFFQRNKTKFCLFKIEMYIRFTLLAELILLCSFCAQKQIQNILFFLMRRLHRKFTPDI